MQVWGVNDYFWENYPLKSLQPIEKTLLLSLTTLVSCISNEWCVPSSTFIKQC